MLLHIENSNFTLTYHVAALNNCLVVIFQGVLDRFGGEILQVEGMLKSLVGTGTFRTRSTRVERGCGFFGGCCSARVDF